MRVQQEELCDRCNEYLSKCDCMPCNRCGEIYSFREGHNCAEESQKT